MFMQLLLYTKLSRYNKVTDELALFVDVYFKGCLYSWDKLGLS